jgi:hypothetical protein
MATTFRVDSVAAHIAVLTAQKTATPTQLRAVHASRPGAFQELPAAYVGNRDERITHPGGQMRTRTMVGLTVVLVDSFADNIQTGDRLDALVDLLVDRYEAAYAQVAGGNSLLQLATVVDTELEITGDPTIVYRAVVLGFGDSFISEGRS